MKGFLRDYFYLLFQPNSMAEDSLYDLFYYDTNALVWGFWILFLSSLVITLVYYVGIGQVTNRYGKLKNWLLFGVLNMLVIFLCTVFLLHFSVFESSTGLGSAHADLWLFGIFNGTVYAILIYLLLSLVVNNFSRYYRYIPFSIIKR